MPKKHVANAQPLTEAQRRRMVRALIDSGKQTEFPYPADCGLKLADLTWMPTETSAAPSKQRRTKRGESHDSRMSR
jgi:hypothetical protein